MTSAHPAAPNAFRVTPSSDSSKLIVQLAWSGTGAREEAWNATLWSALRDLAGSLDFDWSAWSSVGDLRAWLAGRRECDWDGSDVRLAWTVTSTGAGLLELVVARDITEEALAWWADETWEDLRGWWKASNLRKHGHAA